MTNKQTLKILKALRYKLDNLEKTRYKLEAEVDRKLFDITEDLDILIGDLKDA